MIETALLRLLITVWTGAHPITYTLPHLYKVTGTECQAAANHLFAHRKHGVRMKIECIPTDQRNV